MYKRLVLVYAIHHQCPATPDVVDGLISQLLDSCCLDLDYVSSELSGKPETYNDIEAVRIVLL